MASNNGKVWNASQNLHSGTPNPRPPTLVLPDSAAGAAIQSKRRASELGVFDFDGKPYQRSFNDNAPAGVIAKRLLLIAILGSVPIGVIVGIVEAFR